MPHPHAGVISSRCATCLQSFSVLRTRMCPTICLYGPRLAQSSVQGSILSPLLFLVYINDVNEAITGEKIKLFADGTNLFVQGPDIRNVSDRANLIHIWFIANKLTLSLDKSCFTMFSKSTSDSCVIKVTDSKLL